MAKKDLLIGGCTNYGIDQLKPWVLSAAVHMPDADKVMCVGNCDAETREWLMKNEFTLVDMPKLNLPVHVLRFLSIYEYLRDTHDKYRYVLTTDVKDVFFQSNPFEWVHNNMNIPKCKLIAASEGIRYKDEAWGNENLMQTYGAYVHDQFKDNEIYNVGVVAGRSEYVKDMVFNIFTNAVNRPIPIVDQAVYNVLIQTQPFKDVIQFVKHDGAWACQAGTTVDPSKIDSFRPNLLCKEPYFDGEYIYSYGPALKGNKYPIVHQYDRVPEWTEMVRKKFGQEAKSESFIYRTT
jgi:hypothetical protein